MAALVARLPSSRHADVVYHVRITEGVYTCECPGFWRWHHCRHVDALAALKALPLNSSGKLPGVKEVPPRARGRKPSIVADGNNYEGSPARAGTESTDNRSVIGASEFHRC